jgi:diguanylate cyclase (GGDEF)-like protein
MGDAVLDLFAAVARKTMRGDDVIGRIGGEEFVAIIFGKLADACVAGDRVRAAFERAAAGAESPQIPATVSIGIACGVPTASIDTLISRADAALYRAKSNGRNRVEPDREIVIAGAVPPAQSRTDVRSGGMLEPAAALPVPILR